MIMNSPWKLILLLSGIFLAGVVTGGFVAHRHLRKEFSKRMAPEQFFDSRFEMLTKRLSLTADQQAKLKPIMLRDAQELVQIRNNTIAETRKSLERMERDISEVLTPEQRVKFEQINREMRERMKRFLKNRPPGSREGGPPPGEDFPPGPLPPRPMLEKSTTES